MKWNNIVQFLYLWRIYYMFGIPKFHPNNIQETIIYPIWTRVGTGIKSNYLIQFENHDSFFFLLLGINLNYDLRYPRSFPFFSLKYIFCFTFSSCFNWNKLQWLKIREIHYYLIKRYIWSIMLPYPPDRVNVLIVDVASYCWVFIIIKNIIKWD